MRLKSVQLFNYKGIRESPKLLLDPFATTITGRNNAGKTALLDGVSLRFGNRPHLSERSLPDSTRRPAPESFAQVEVELLSGDVADFLRSYEGNFLIPGEARLTPEENLRTILTRARTLTFRRTGSSGVTFPRMPFDCVGSPAEKREFQKHANADATPTGSTYAYAAGNHGNELELGIALRFAETIYRFNAERFNLGRFPAGRSGTSLNPDAGNLPEVLSVLQSNTSRFARYNALVHRVLPHVAKVSVRPVGSDLEIIVWRGRPESEREDLAIPLSECGTGIGQVLAILYVIVTSEKGRTVIVDEPNSFLHPGAVSALLEVFAEHRQHQYIVATHSATVLANLSPQTLYLVDADEHETTVTELDHRTVAAQRRFLASVGASLADVLGPERILWVEGPSEALSFPIVADAASISRSRAAILPVVNTGDFDPRKVETSVRIYSGLAAGVGLVPKACGFVFDREKRSEEDCKRISSRVAATVVFLQRKMFENYLLNPDAVAEWANTFESTGGGAKITAQSFRNWIAQEAAATPPRTFETTQQPWSGPWLAEVHAASLLTGFIASVTSQADTYDKVRDAPVLTALTLKHCKDDLKEISDLLGKLLKPPAP